MGDKLLFFTNFISNPGAIGSLLPSSPQLVKDLLDGVDFGQARVIVEYGPGTGAFTDEIMKRLHPDAKFLCIELLDDFYATLRARYNDPRFVLVHGSAADVESLLATHGLAAPDAIVSGLPFTSLPENMRHEILAASIRSLKPGGRFVLYQYSQFLMKHLRRYFARITTRWTLFNAPPAFYFYCEDPRLETLTPANAGT